MKANEFVKKFGLDAFRLSVGFVSTRKYLVVYEDEIDFTDEIKPSHGECVFDSLEVKRLVESHELVKSRGGLDAAKHELILLQKHLNNTFGYVTIITSEKIENLKQAIADVESCQ